MERTFESQKIKVVSNQRKRAARVPKPTFKDPFRPPFVLFSSLWWIFCFSTSGDGKERLTCGQKDGRTEPDNNNHQGPKEALLRGGSVDL